MSRKYNSRDGCVHIFYRKLSVCLYTLLRATMSSQNNEEVKAEVAAPMAQASAAQPVITTAWSGVSGPVSFSANAGRLVSLGGFTQSINPSGQFTLDSASGKLTYTGHASIYVRVTVNYSVSMLAPLAAQSLVTYISKNGSAAVAGPSNKLTFSPGGPVFALPGSLTDVLQLAHGDCIQLGAKYSATSPVPFSCISYAVSGA